MSLNKNILNTFLTQFPVIIFSFITGVFITRTIGVEGKGIYAIFATNIQLLALFTGFSINTGIVYFISSEKIRLNKVLGLSVYILLFSVVLGTLIVFIPFNSENALFPKNFNSIYYKLYLVISFIIIIINTIFIGIFQARRKYSLINYIAIANSVIGALLFTIVYFTGYIDVFNDKLDNVLLYSLVIISINAILYFVFFIKNVRILPNLRINYIDEFKPFFKYIGVVYISQVINFFNYRLDIWFVNIYNGVEQLGLYSLAVNLSQMLLMVSNPIVNVLFPYLSNEKDLYKKNGLLMLLSRINISLLLFGVIVFYFMGKYFIPFVYGNDFAASISSFNIMIAAAFFLGASRVFSTYLSSENQVNYNLLATLIAFSITLSLNILLIPKYGIIGASITSLLAYFTIFVVVFLRTTYLNNNLIANWFFVKKSDFKQIKKMKE